MPWEDWLDFIPCFEDFVADFSLLERRAPLGRRECDEDGLSRGDFGGGMPSSPDYPFSTVAAADEDSRMSAVEVALEIGAVWFVFRIDVEVFVVGGPVFGGSSLDGGMTS